MVSPPGARPGQHNEKHKLLAAVVGSGATSLASASAYACIGTLDFVSVTRTGTVTVSSPSSGLMTFYPCSLTSTVNGVDGGYLQSDAFGPDVGQSDGAQVGWWFNDSIGCDQASFNGSNWYYRPQNQ